MYEELLLTILLTSVPLILAATGELVAERSGVLNLGVEGMMLMGAVAAFGAASLSGNVYLGILGGGLSGMLVAGIFGFFVLGLATNQVATGLALTIFGTGLSGLIGAPLVGKAIDGLPALVIPGLSELPLVGVLFQLDLLAYLSVLIVVLTSWFLMHTRGGLILRSVGINHDSAHALGYPVLWVRLGAVLFGGFMAGLAGAYLPLVLTPHWAEQMTAGRGWIALALVVFASWRPWRVVIGAVLFGGVTIMQLAGQAKGWTIPSQFLSMMPYIATIIVLVAISSRGRVQFGAPAHLGKSFHATR
jgi:ABC-type uncharacterized transport system permease subunit